MGLGGILCAQDFGLVGYFTFLFEFDNHFSCLLSELLQFRLELNNLEPQYGHLLIGFLERLQTNRILLNLDRKHPLLVLHHINIQLQQLQIRRRRHIILSPQLRIEFIRIANHRIVN